MIENIMFTMNKSDIQRLFITFCEILFKKSL